MSDQKADYKRHKKVCVKQAEGAAAEGAAAEKTEIDLLGGLLKYLLQIYEQYYGVWDAGLMAGFMQERVIPSGNTCSWVAVVKAIADTENAHMLQGLGASLHEAQFARHRVCIQTVLAAEPALMEVLGPAMQPLPECSSYSLRFTLNPAYDIPTPNHMSVSVFNSRSEGSIVVVFVGRQEADSLAHYTGLELSTRLASMAPESLQLIDVVGFDMILMEAVMALPDHYATQCQDDGTMVAVLDFMGAATFVSAFARASDLRPCV